MKNKYLFLVLLSLLLVYNVFAIDIGSGYPPGIRITDDKLKYEVGEEEDVSNTEEYDITWETVNQMSYIRFNYTGRFLGNNVRHGLKKYLVLYARGGYYGGSYIFLYDENNTLVKVFSDRTARVKETATAEIRATSELREGNTAYAVSNLLNRCELRPWVEGKRDSGIGEKIRLVYNLKPHATNGFSFAAIILSNGFVDYNRPYLYEYNNRIKKIRISRGDSNEYIDIDIEDTPQLQFFWLMEDLKTESNILEIEILEIYRGSHYDDTCINMIIPWGNFLWN